MENFIKQLKNALEADPDAKITEATVLNDLEEWDSLGRFSFLALAFDKYDAALNPDKVREAATVGSLWKLIEESRG